MTLFLCFISLITQFGGGKEASSTATGAGRVEVVLFSDFQCPFCAQLAPAFSELQAKGVEGVEVTVRFKHFPLNIHPEARLAHLAALAAGEQGKFWEMHDLLFANPHAISRDDLMRYAARLRLDLDRFKKDIDGARLKKLIEADIAEGQRLRVQGTPIFFVNGKEYSGSRSFDQLKHLIQGDLRRARARAEVPDDLLSQGPRDAAVIIELFADLQSPVSRQAIEVLDRLTRIYPGKVRIQFRNFPLAFHPQSPLAHEAAMAAASLGHFWELARYILGHQDSLREQDLVAQAGRIGLDQAKFAELLAQHRYAARVEADLDAGEKRGIRGSPVIFVNANRIDGVPAMEKLVEYVESELAAMSKSEARRP
jgi:protein-disulfide isomerase